MNWRYVVIAMMVLIPFIMMGKNPFEPPEGYVPPDEFKDNIRSRIDQPAGFGAMGGVGGGGAIGGGMLNIPNPSSYQGGMINNPSGVAGAITPNPAPPGIAPPNAALQGNSPAVDPAPSTMNPYAPQPLQQNPPPQSNPFQNLPTPGSRLELPPAYPSFTDNEGRTIAFVGANVYTADASGRAQLLADGEYALSNGQTLIVKNGKKWWPVNANKL